MTLKHDQVIIHKTKLSAPMAKQLQNIWYSYQKLTFLLIFPIGSIFYFCDIIRIVYHKYELQNILVVLYKTMNTLLEKKFIFICIRVVTWFITFIYIIIDCSFLGDINDLFRWNILKHGIWRYAYKKSFENNNQPSENPINHN